MIYNLSHLTLPRRSAEGKLKKGGAGPRFRNRKKSEDELGRRI